MRDQKVRWTQGKAGVQPLIWEESRTVDRRVAPATPGLAHTESLPLLSSKRQQRVRLFALYLPSLGLGHTVFNIRQTSPQMIDLRKDFRSGSIN